MRLINVDDLSEFMKTLENAGAEGFTSSDLDKYVECNSVLDVDDLKSNLEDKVKGTDICESVSGDVCKKFTDCGICYGTATVDIVIKMIKDTFNKEV